MRTIEYVTSFIIFSALSFLVLDHFYPFLLFLKKYTLLALPLMWFLLITVVIYKGWLFSLKVYWSREEKKAIAKLKPDMGQAKTVLQLYKRKCEGRKALMITAAWGTGKTSFYKVSLKPILKAYFFDFKWAEVSCFGLSSQDTLIEQILNKLFFISFFAIFLGQVKQILSSSTHLKRALIPKRSIIVIDDFERFSGQHAELMGLFDYLIQQKKCHIFIFCNEEKINKQQYYQQYHDLSEKIIVKHAFETAPKQMKEIMLSEEFAFNNEPYYFSEPIIDQFIQIVGVTKNFRTAWEAHKDLIEISQQLAARLKEVNLPQEKKEAWLKRYFEEGCSRIIKAVFIKNAHKVGQYLQYRSKVKKSKGNRGEIEIEDDFLHAIGSIQLKYDTCIAGSYLSLEDFLISYLQGTDLYDEDFINETIIQFILVPIIHQEIDNCLDDSNQHIDDTKAIKRLESIKESFFTFLKFIQNLPPSRSDCYMFICYKIFSLKYDLKTDEAEKILIDDIENKLTKLVIVVGIKNILSTSQYLPDGFIGKIDPGEKLLQQLLDRDYVDVSTANVPEIFTI